MLLVSAVRRSARELDISPADRATFELALIYAREIDQCETVHARLVKLLRAVEALDVDIHDQLVPLAARAHRQHVIATIGPKLLAALEALEASPRARAAVQRLVSSAGDHDSPLDQLRARRAARLDDSAPLDAGAP